MVYNVKQILGAPDRLKIALVKWAELLLLSLLLLTGVLESVRSVMQAANMLNSDHVYTMNKVR